MRTALTTLLAAGYIRVSDEKGRAGQDNFHSPIEQRDTIENCGVVRSGAVEVTEWVEAIDVSSKGGHNFQQPDFLAMVDSIKRGDLNAVIVPRFDRFGRDLKESLVMIDVIEKAGGYVISASETTTDDAAGRLARNAFLMFANYQLDRITENWRGVHNRNHEKGIAHGQAAVGYVKGEGGKLEKHPDYAAHVAWAFERAAAGTPLLRIWRELVSRGVPVRSHQTLQKILRNRVYLGEIRRGKRPVITGAHPAITTPTIFAAAQRSKRRTWAPQDYLLTGLVRCEGCGASMSYMVTKHPTYACQTDGCPAPSAITAARIEPYVEEAWREHQDDVLCQAALIAPALLDLENDHLTAQESVRLWMQNEAAQRANMDLWNEELDRRAQVERETARALTDAHAKAGMRRGVPGNMSIFDVYDSGTNTEKRELLRAGIAAVYVKKVGRGVRVPVEERCRIEF